MAGIRVDLIIMHPLMNAPAFFPVMPIGLPATEQRRQYNSVYRLIILQSGQSSKYSGNDSAGDGTADRNFILTGKTLSRAVGSFWSGLKRRDVAARASK
jgi:hypothetical protein